jgi:hypothetical protein
MLPLGDKERLKSGSFFHDHFAGRIGSLSCKRNVVDYVELLLKWSWTGGARR